MREGLEGMAELGRAKTVFDPTTGPFSFVHRESDISPSGYRTLIGKCKNTETLGC